MCYKLSSIFLHEGGTGPVIEGKYDMLRSNLTWKLDGMFMNYTMKNVSIINFRYSPFFCPT